LWHDAALRTAGCSHGPELKEVQTLIEGFVEIQRRYSVSGSSLGDQADVDDARQSNQSTTN